MGPTLRNLKTTLKITSWHRKRDPVARFQMGTGLPPSSFPTGLAKHLSDSADFRPPLTLQRPRQLTCAIVVSDSWQMLPAGSRSPWRRRFSQSSRWPCPALCLEGVCPLRHATAVEALLPLWPRPSPPPLHSAAALQQVSGLAPRDKETEGDREQGVGDRRWLRLATSLTLYWFLQCVDLFFYLLLKK
jgi:hypothetical protein